MTGSMEIFLHSQSPQSTYQSMVVIIAVSCETKLESDTAICVTHYNLYEINHI